MKTTIALLLAAVMMVVVMTATVLVAPNFTYQPPNKFTSKWETVPALVPASATDPFAANTKAVGTSWVDAVTLTNVSGSNCLVTIVDQSPVPQTVLKILLPGYDGSTPSANNYIASLNHRLAYGGVKWSACDGTSVTGYLRVEK